ncbi:MAG TPA: hypothetical protein VFH78_02200 [Candidatus Thermoplasmatota archaeon]|nr:hypothetical protein [Candidatus Thermoplasmatota archaeon]
METPPAVRRYAHIGFWVPAGIALVADVAGLVSVWGDDSGYQGLVFIFFMMIGVPATIVWMIVGAIVARTSGPPGSGRAFATGAAVALGAMLILFSATCFLTYA